MRKYFYSTLLSFCIALEGLSAESFLKPRNIDLGIDIGRLLYYGLLIEPTYSLLNYGYKSTTGYSKPTLPRYSGLQYETYLALQYSRLILDLEFGGGQTEWRGKRSQIVSKQTGENLKEEISSKYESKGKYVKLGFDLNFLKNTLENNTASIGLRYCISVFDDALKTKLAYASLVSINTSNLMNSKTLPITANDPYSDIDTSQRNVVATWLEAVAGVKMHLLSIVSCGCSLRYKFWLKIHNADLHRPYDVLGWGLNSDPVDRSAFGYNLYISLSLPLGQPEAYDRNAGKKKDSPRGTEESPKL